MPRLRIFVFLSFAVFACSWVGAVPVKREELPPASALVVEVLTVHPRVRKAEALVAAAYASWQGSGLQPNPLLTFAATAGDAGEDSNSLSQSFEISGQPKLRSEQAKARVEAAKLFLWQIRREVAAGVYRDWLRIWESEHQLMLADLRLTVMAEMVKVARRRYEVGEIPRNESLRVELAEAEAKADFEKAKAEFVGAQQSLDIFKVLVERAVRRSGGSDTSEQAVMKQDYEAPSYDRTLRSSESDNFSEVQPASAAPAEATPEGRLADPMTEGLDLERLFERPNLGVNVPEWTIDEALIGAGEHPLVEATHLESLALWKGAELAKKERAPMLGLSLYTSRFSGQTVDRGIQLSLSWPVWDWGSVAAKHRAQEHEAEAKEAEAQEEALKLNRQVADLWSQWQAAKAVRQILESQARRYEELARKARIGYDLGLLSLTDVLETESAFRQAGVELIEAQVQVARIELGLLESTNLPWPGASWEQ